MSAVATLREAASEARAPGTAVGGLLERFAPVSLGELEAEAGLLTRTDRKYVVPPAVLAPVLAVLAGRARALRIDGARAFRYESVYFDTPDLALYRAAARGRPRRAKVRTRWYADSGLCMLEVKRRDGHGRTVKSRQPHPADDRWRVTADGAAFLDGQPGAADVRDRLGPTLTTGFTRSTLLLPAGRATFDVGLVLATADDRRASLTGAVLVETKSVGRPTELDRLLWAHHVRPVRLSKYGVGLAALHPELPGNRWHRVVREHVVVD